MLFLGGVIFSLFRFILNKKKRKKNLAVAFALVKTHSRTMGSVKCRGKNSPRPANTQIRTWCIESNTALVTSTATKRDALLDCKKREGEKIKVSENKSHEPSQMKLYLNCHCVQRGLRPVHSLELKKKKKFQKRIIKLYTILKDFFFSCGDCNALKCEKITKLTLNHKLSILVYNTLNDVLYK